MLSGGTLERFVSAMHLISRLKVQHLVGSWLRDRGGQFVLVLSILAPIALGLIGGAMDFLVFINHQSQLQDTADAAVLAVAREASLKGWNNDAAKQVAAAVIEGSLGKKFGAEHRFELVVSKSDRRVEIVLDQDHYGYFVAGYFAGSPQIRVKAAAFAAGVSTLCIIVQSPNQKDALTVSGGSAIRASGCSTYSNSTSAESVNLKDTSLLWSQTSCTAGGYKGKQTNFRPIPVTDCPPIPDPLAERAHLIDASLANGCDYQGVSVKGGAKTLRPGTYCKKLEIKDGADVTLEPGIYVFKEEMKVDKAAKISGTGVGMVFVGKDAKMNLANDSSVSLSAPASGIMAGILIYGQPVNKARKFAIVSKDAQKLTGTVYLPSDTLTVGGDDDLDGSCDPVVEEDDDDDEDENEGTPTPPSCVSDAGSASDWTAIIVRQLKVTAGSTLVMNTNYDGSTVPVPGGIGPSSQRVILTR